MIVYANSDSYGVMGTTQKRYPEFLAEMLGAEVINNGKSGVCNQRIIRCTIRDLIELRKTDPDKKILAVICLGSMIRNEWWNADYVPQESEVDGHFQSFQIHGVKQNSDKKFLKFANEWYRLYNDEAEQTNFFLKLVLLTTWFRNNDIEYIIFAGNNVTYKTIDYRDVFIKSFAEIIFNDPRIFDINQFSFTKFCLDQGHRPFDFDQWGEHGHHAEPAHRQFAKFLFSCYNKS